MLVKYILNRGIKMKVIIASATLYVLLYYCTNLLLCQFCSVQALVEMARG